MTTRNEDYERGKVDGAWEVCLALSEQFGEEMRKVHDGASRNEWDAATHTAFAKASGMALSKERESSLGRDAEGHLILTLGPGSESPSRKDTAWERYDGMSPLEQREADGDR